MVRRHDEDELLAAAVEAALDGGLGELTFGRLSKRIGIPDRTLVYYFANKATLFEAVLGQMAVMLFEQLEAAFGEQRRSSPQLLKAAWPVLTGPDADRIFAVWLELAGQAAVGHEPHRSLASQTVEAWIEWLAERVDAATPARRRAEAESMVALLDGALLVRHLGHPDAADRAVRSAQTGRAR